MLRECHAQAVKMSFDGCGDSGSIDAISYGDAKVDAASVQIEVEVFDRVFETDRREVTCRTLDLAIEELTNDYLEETQVNWYDNDGGYGELTIDVQAGTVTLEVNVRTTESSSEYWRTLDIQTGEEV